MKCPDCKKISLCGCKSCKGRRKNSMQLLRTEKFVKGGDYVKCPYCRENFHYDILVSIDFDEYDKEQEEKRISLTH